MPRAVSFSVLTQWGATLVIQLRESVCFSRQHFETSDPLSVAGRAPHARRLSRGVPTNQTIAHTTAGPNILAVWQIIFHETDNDEQ